MQKAQKDYLTKLSVREIRLEAKKLLIHLYSRKNKLELVELIFNDREKLLIEDNSNDELKAEEERKVFENSKAEEERKALDNAKAEEERKVFENVIAQEELKTNSDEYSYLKRLLSESFPNKNVSVTDNKDGSQTILIY